MFWDKDNRDKASILLVNKVHVIMIIPNMCWRSYVINYAFSNLSYIIPILGFPGGASGKELSCQRRRQGRCKFDPWVRKIPWRRNTPVFLPGEPHGQRSLEGYSPWGRKESNMTEEP